MLFTLSIWFKRKEHFAGEMQPQMQQEAEIQSTRPHTINCCMSHCAPSPSHLHQYYSQMHGTGDSLVEVAALGLPGASDEGSLTIITRIGQLIWAKFNVLLHSVSLHHCTHNYTQISV